ncbi:MAG: hypothetical protein ACEQSE_00340 [Candidatus Aquirickettsiella gammari]
MTSNSNSRSDIRFGIDNCQIFYKKLKFEDERLNISHGNAEKSDDYDTYAFDAFNFCVTASHLNFDWLENDTEYRPTLAMDKKAAVKNSSNDIPPEMDKILSAIRNLSDGSKHLKLTRLNKIVVDEVTTPEICDYFSYWFGPQFGLTIGELYFTLGDLQGIVMSYFEWIFDANLGTENFPAGITKSINYIKKNSG